MKQPQTVEKDAKAEPVVEKPTDKPDTPTFQPESKDDHVAHIVALAQQLATASHSGIETIAQKILEHTGAIQDPKSYDARKAAEFKAQQEQDALSAKIKAEDKAKSAQ